MTGYLVLGAVIFWIISAFAAFLFGFGRGRKAERQTRQEDAERRVEDAAFYQTEKDRIMREAFGNAEQKKAELSRGTAGRERFDKMNDALRG
jgi:hypothetical protein